jgi:ribosomal protein S18 acetylase RimI-like enzyme
LTAQDGIVIEDVPVGARARLGSILEESFEGWYLRHSMRTLLDAEVVKAAVSSGVDVGLVMLNLLEGDAGYVFYIAVTKDHRRKGVARMLLEDALAYFRAAGMKDAYASVEEDNTPSERLFESEGFVKTSFSELSKKRGTLQALDMYRKMRVVPGETLLFRNLV